MLQAEVGLQKWRNGDNTVALGQSGQPIDLGVSRCRQYDEGRHLCHPNDNIVNFIEYLTA